jgi:predicted nucleic acid-binding protein
MAYVLDSNIISYLLKGDKLVRERLKEAIQANEKLIIPHTVHYEIERWLIEKGATAKQADLARMLEDDLSLEALNLDVWTKAAALYVETRKKGFQPGDADLLIAAFCLTHEYTLVTNNAKDFEIIDGLDFVNWKE